MCKIYILRREILIMKMNFCITISGKKATVVDESIKVKAGKQFRITLQLRGMAQLFQSLRIKERKDENSICFEMDCFGAFR